MREQETDRSWLGPGYGTKLVEGSEVATFLPASPRVLLVEDDADLRALVAAALELDGLNVVSLTDGEALLDEVRRCMGSAGGDAIDLIVTDQRMPKMSGLSAIRTLRSTGLSCPVLLVTAFADRTIQDEAGHWGAHVVEKPVRLQALRKHIHAMLATDGRVGAA